MALRDETQLQVLQNRGNSKWIRENIADAFAKSICAQVTLNKRTPDVQQNKKLQGDALQQEVENIKNHPVFQNMLKNAGPEKMAEAVIKGGRSLFEVYNKAAQTAAREGHVQQANDIRAEMVEPKRDTNGLVSGYQP